MDLNALMDNMKVVFLVVFCLCAGCQLIRYILLEYRIYRNNKAPVYTDRAVAHYKHEETDAPYLGRGYSYVHYITFHTDSGIAVKLYMNSDDFYIIQEGDTGELTWQGNKLWKFIPDKKKEESVNV